MADAWRDVSDDEDEDIIIEETRKSAVIFLIDCRKKMFDESVDGESLFDVSLRCVLACMKSRIIVNENDMIGMVFVGSREKRNMSDFENVFFFYPPDVPTAERINNLKAMIGKRAEFEKAIGSNDNVEDSFPIDSGIWACSSAFSNAQLNKKDDQRIWIFTNDDEPKSAQSRFKALCQQRAKDALGANKKTQVWFLSHECSRALDPLKFYKDVAQVEEDSGDFKIFCDGTIKPFELVKNVRLKQHKKRTLNTLEFSFDETMKMGLKMYCMILSAKVPSAEKVEAATNIALKCQTQYLCETTGQVLNNAQIKKYVPFGAAGDRAYLTAEEVATIKKFDTPGIRLLGFKDASEVDIVHNLRAPYFLHPADDNIEGSSCMSNALIHSLKVKNKIAIVSLIARSNATPRLCAMYPQSEEVDVEDGTQVLPDGFWLVPLPYADDMRALDVLPPQKTASQEQVDAAKNMIEKLTMTKDPGLDGYPNPCIRKHYAALEQLALNEEEMQWDTNQDDCLPPTNLFLDPTRAEKIEDFKKSWGGEELTMMTASQKRSAAGGAPARKRATADVDISGHDWRQEAMDGKLGQYTMPILKAVLKQVCKKPVSGRKQELIDRISASFV
eukprot:TRINITY_DN131804_c0_g1_i1.p1 TRINITY_DN131804_c0_g1~~TRINITY_DN131804_c0_g1_i1.p1  ORF type:complete len:614 (-),score=191.50 TRINITY_DN131804_c0_g1_i1:58-1899(-)